MDLSSSISELPKIGPYFLKKFEKLGIKSIENLFYHVPTRYLDYSLITTISLLQPGQVATIHAKINSLKNIYSKRGLKMQIGSVEDDTGKLMVIWFNQPYLIKTLYPGRYLSLSGKVGYFNRKLCLSSPDYEILPGEESETLHTGKLIPVYPETLGLSSRWIRRKMSDAFKLTEINEYLPDNIIKKNDLVNLRKAIKFVHFPDYIEEVKVGKRRLAFDELLNLELQSYIRKINWKKNKVAHKVLYDKTQLNKFIASIPFSLTDSQNNAVKDILKNIASDIPMNRLLEGDVGSGKTVVSAIVMFAVFSNGYQSVIMAPTQILAQQHYKTLKLLFKSYKIRISLITGSSKKTEIGRSDIFIGTHALIHKNVAFDNIAFVVIDEQHRFGVEQRLHLIKKSGTPHVLTMTATPIPRTIALTLYGDMDLSVLTEVPKGRTKVKTWVVPETKRDNAYKWIADQILLNKSQVFIVCPLIEDSETETMADVKSVSSEFLRLKTIFKDQKLGLLHGRLKAKEKDSVLDKFRMGKLDILVATPVVEVGIDIPNATIMVVEAAERFGLAQLHQLRGRVGRGKKESYCLLFTNFRTGKSYTRLKAMEKSFSGFELSELDLKLRGPGEIFGTIQSGFPELKIAGWNNYELIKTAKDAAEVIISNPQKYPKIINKIDESIKQ